MPYEKSVIHRKHNALLSTSERSDPTTNTAFCSSFCTWEGAILYPKRTTEEQSNDLEERTVGKPGLFSLDLRLKQLIHLMTVIKGLD